MGDEVTGKTVGTLVDNVGDAVDDVGTVVVGTTGDAVDGDAVG